jgi:chromosome segregation ATPase
VHRAASLEQELARAQEGWRAAAAHTCSLLEELATARSAAERLGHEHREALAAASRQSDAVRGQLLELQRASAEQLEQLKREASQLRLQLRAAQRKLMAGKAAAAALQQQRDASSRLAVELQQRLARQGEESERELAQQREALERERGQEVLRLGFHQAQQAQLRQQQHQEVAQRMRAAQQGVAAAQRAASAAKRLAAEQAQGQLHVPELECRLSTYKQRVKWQDDHLKRWEQAYKQAKAERDSQRTELKRFGDCLVNKVREADELREQLQQAQARAAAAVPAVRARAEVEGGSTRRGGERSEQAAPAPSASLESGEIQPVDEERKRRRGSHSDHHRDGPTKGEEGRAAKHRRSNLTPLEGGPRRCSGSGAGGRERFRGSDRNYSRPRPHRHY